MFQDILTEIIIKSDEIYDKLMNSKSIFNDAFNLNLYNYSSISIDLINSVKEKYIEKIQNYIDYIETLDIIDANSETLFSPLCDIICDNNLSIFKLYQIHPNDNIQIELEKTKNILYKYVSRRFLDSDFYDKFKYLLSETSYENKKIIQEFIKELEKYQENINDTTDTTDTNDIINYQDKNNKENIYLEDTLNTIIDDLITKFNINIDINFTMSFILWDSSVTIMEITKNNTKIGYVYLDIYSRINKKYYDNIILLTYKYNNILPVYCLNLNFNIDTNMINQQQSEILTKKLNEIVNLINNN